MIRVMPTDINLLYDHLTPHSDAQTELHVVLEACLLLILSVTFLWKMLGLKFAKVKY